MCSNTHTITAVIEHVEMNIYRRRLGAMASWRRNLTAIELVYRGTPSSGAQVRTTPSWPRSWANLSLFCLYSHRNVWANSHLLGQPNTFLAQDDVIGPSRYKRVCWCDICSRFAGVGSTLFGCRAEDYDICKVRDTPGWPRCLGRLQPFLAVFSQGCMGQLAPFGPT